MVTLPGGKIKTLGKDPHGATRKNPPPEIVEAWHALDRVRKPAEMLFADVAAKYLEYLTNPGSRKSAKDHLDWFIAHVGGKIKVSQLRVHDVNGYLKTKEWAESTKATAVNRIVSALNWAVNEGYIEDHRVKFAKGKKPRYERRKSELTAEQQARLEAACFPALRTFLIALRESGCRPKELCCVTIDKADLKAGVMMVPNKVAGKTGDKFRTVYMTKTLVELARGSIGDREEGFVFLNSHGTQWKTSTINNRVRKIRLKIGLPEGTVPYAYRGKFASDAINDSNANPALVARLLGHSDLTMLLKHYLTESPEAMRKALEEITGK